MAERLGSRAINHKVVGSIPGCAKWRCVLGQGTSPYLPRGECPCTYCKSLWIRASAKWLNVNMQSRNLQCVSRVKDWLWGDGRGVVFCECSDSIITSALHSEHVSRVCNGRGLASSVRGILANVHSHGESNLPPPDFQAQPLPTRLLYSYEPAEQVERASESVGGTQVCYGEPTGSQGWHFREGGWITGSQRQIADLTYFEMGHKDLLSVYN